jgi:hypothetical protein
MKVKTIRYNSWYRPVTFKSPSLTSQKFSVFKEGKRVEVYKWFVERKVECMRLMFGYVVHVASIADLFDVRNF